MRVTFYGVRGSFPCPSPANRRYGGNTASVALEVEGEPPIFLDLGTGLPRYDTAPATRDGRPFRAAALVTHLHLDHVQGLAFFPVVHEAGTQLDVYGPPQEEGSLREGFARLVDPPYFPLTLDQVVGDLRFHEVCRDELAIGGADVTVRAVPHLGPTVGYRVAWGGGTLAYISDHQAPTDPNFVDPDVLELCDGVDLLIHEGQYTPEEFEAKGDWGHCTVDYAARVARASGARRLCIFHHDPWRTDDQLDAVIEAARGVIGGATQEVLAAAEGMTLTVVRSPSPTR
ncbi:MAG TPA: MBL fold metallo-hydrolase [Acidimicrobiales bacterium]|jgi:ribonuclease BN (tRNA processing enzyme)|nr:MBL fold metallo-hydrolase [Acidimicrobiales bacterium]